MAILAVSRDLFDLRKRLGAITVGYTWDGEPVTAEQLKAAHDADLAIERDEGVHFERAWLDPDAGKVFCLATGPSREAVMRIHERAGHPTAEVYELPIEV
jgi:hypothetical protein